MWRKGCRVSTLLQIRWVRAKTRTHGWQKEYNLDAPVIAIVGVVDTGKSSLLDCIAFALGADVPEFRGAVDRELLAVEIGVRLPTGEYVLRRSRSGSPGVDIVDASGTEEGRFPIKTKEQRPTMSEWLLTQLGLVDMLGSTRLPGGKYLDFASAVLPYCYLNQFDIDRQIIAGPRDDHARLISLKLMFNLTAPEYEQLAGQIHEHQLEIERRVRRSETLVTFLRESQSTDPEAVAEQVRHAQTELAAAKSRLTASRDHARALTQHADRTRERLRVARTRVADAEIALDRVALRRDRLTERIGQIEHGLAALTEFETQPPETEPPLALAHERCYKCRGDLSQRAVEPGCCHVCGLLLPGREHEGERRRLVTQLQQLSTELEGLRTPLATADNAARDARRALHELNEQLQREAGDTLSPFVESIAAAASDAAAWTARLEALSGLQDAHDRITVQRTEIQELREAQDERRARHVLHSADIENLDDVLDPLNDLFRRIVGGIELPNATGRARIDRDTMLPWVDDQRFSQRGGGARAALSIAYSLALLNYTLQNALATLPSLLMVDSPQKNYGANEDDKALSHRVYRRFLDLVQQRDDDVIPQSWQRPYQLIIIDNDIPDDIAARIKVHRFTRDNGFLRDLTHPHGPPAPAEQLMLDGFTGTDDS